MLRTGSLLVAALRIPARVAIGITKQSASFTQCCSPEGRLEFSVPLDTVDNIKIVALAELIKSDPTLNQLFNLDYGEQATREHPGGKWTRSKLEYEDDEPNSH